jgi:uncharacterized membrane protein
MIQEKSKPSKLIFDWRFIFKTTFIALFLLVIFFFAYTHNNPLTDWDSYRSAVFAMLHGQTNPPGMYNPPWIYIPLIPLALLPPALGNAIIAILCYLIYYFVARKLGADFLTTLIFLSMPQIFFLSHNGSIDWIIPLGFILPTWLGLFIILAKPQIGLAVAIFWGIASLRENGFWKTIKTFAPVTIAYALFILIYRPEWGNLMGKSWDASIWPFGIPIGLALLAQAIIKRDQHLSILASPFLAPYIGFYSWPAALLGLANRKWVMISAVVGMWTIAILKGYF